MFKNSLIFYDLQYYIIHKHRAITVLASELLCSDWLMQLKIGDFKYEFAYSVTSDAC